MRVLIFLLLAIITFGCGQNKSSKNAAASTEPVVVELSVSGMTCMGCVETVRSSIAQVQGVDSVSVSLDSANAIVKFKPQTTDSVSIRKAVELNGYKVTSIKAQGQ